MTIMMKEQYINTNVIVNIIYKEVKKNELKIQCEFWFFRIFVVVIIDLLTKKKKVFLPIESLLHESHRQFINLTTYTRQSLKVSLLT